MKVVKITLEDKGQDFIQMFVSEETGQIIDVKPFCRSVWVGASVPIHDTSMVAEGKPFPIHNPPHVCFGFLEYKIKKIEHITCEQ